MSPGADTHRPRPEAAITTAGTRAQRCGWLVKRVVRAASIAQPAPNATSAAPVITYSDAPAKTTRVSTRAAVAPAARDPAMTRATGVRRPAGTSVRPG